MHGCLITETQHGMERLAVDSAVVKVHTCLLSLSDYINLFIFAILIL